MLSMTRSCRAPCGPLAASCSRRAQPALPSRSSSARPSFGFVAPR
uniref:Uncharacterized protein n=1 Tax=Arundo donax TaxID=35708 RepID=A0A0A8YWL6_ARUDO